MHSEYIATSPTGGLSQGFSVPKEQTSKVEFDTVKCFSWDRVETVPRIDTTEARFPDVVDGFRCTMTERFRTKDDTSACVALSAMAVKF